jgi:hypothetical protein
MNSHGTNENEEIVKSTPQLPSGPSFRAAGEMAKGNVHSSIDVSEGDE